MSGITQTVPNYIGGISEQPDQLKLPGQVKSIENAIPDAVKGLYKRPGAKRIGSTKLSNVQSGGSWFHYYRDETEGCYIGQVAADGKIRMWCTKDLYNSSGTKVNSAGDEIFVHYDTISGAYTQSNYDASNKKHTSITSYLTPSPATDSEDIQALTINDTTFLNNRSKIVSTQYDDGTYARSGNTVTITKANHGLAVGDRINIDFTTGSATDGEYTIQTVADADTLTITDSASGTTSGNLIFTPFTPVRPHKNFAYIQLLRTENGRQYALNIYDSDATTTIKTATRIKHVSNDLGTGRNSGQCKGIGTKVYSGAETNTGSKKNLTFRISALGQQGVIDNVGGSVEADEYGCSYRIDVVLLHGGEGWEADGNNITVNGPSTKGKLSSGTGTSGSNNVYDAQSTFTLQITEHEEIPVKASIKAVRPAPTPFDSDTSVTADAVLGGIAGELTGVTVNGNALNYKIIGSGIYLYTENDADDFNVEVVNQDLMRVMQSEINTVEDLPIQCVDGVIVKINNTKNSDEDDYYVKFVGENGKDGYGSWVECAEPGIDKILAYNTMPHILQRQTISGSNPVIFLAKRYTWADREIGDDTSNPKPSFVGKTINKVLFFRNRLTFLSGENVITSRVGTIANPNFWSNTALAVSVIDPIDISCASTYPSDLYDGIEITGGLLCFSTNAQFLLASDDTIFNPDTAKLRAISWYNYDKVTPPISLGRTVGFADNSNKYSRFMEIAGVSREAAPILQNTSELVPTLLPKDIDLITNSRENNLVFFGKTGNSTITGYKYLRIGNEQQQSAWFKWKFKNNLKYHFCINDEYYYLDSNDFLQSINIIQADADPSIDQDSVNYLLHLDNHTTISNGVFDSGTNKTTFTNQSDWIDDITNGDEELVLVDSNTNSTRIGRYAECTVINGDDFTVPGDWSGATVHIGYLYDYQVDFPRFYLQQAQGETVKSDINSKLTVHRMKLNFGKIGLYETTLTRVGKDPYTEVYESTDLDEYEASDAPYLVEKIKDIPIYERNLNVDVTLKSSHPAPATLRSMSWEGDWSPMHYRRV